MTPATPATPANVDVDDPLASYQAVLDGTSAVAIAPPQRAKLRRLATELARQRAYLAERKRDAAGELARAVAAVTPEDSRVLAAYDLIAAQDAALGRAQLVARLGARAVLDPEQRAAVEGTTRRATVARSRITVRSPVAGSVYIDDKRVGDTPVTITVASGMHEVRLEAAGYDSLLKRFDVGDSSEIVLELDPRQWPARSTPPPRSPSPSSSPSGASGHLTLTTKPSTAVYLDGTSVGQTPVDLTLTTGRHELKMIGKDRRTRKTLTLDVTAGQRSSLSFTFDD